MPASLATNWAISAWPSGRFANSNRAVEALGAARPPALPGSVRRMIARKYGNLYK